MPHRFLLEQEPMFPYRACAILDDRAAGLQGVAMTERVIGVCAGLLVDAYDEPSL